MLNDRQYAEITKALEKITYILRGIAIILCASFGFLAISKLGPIRAIGRCAIGWRYDLGTRVHCEMGV